MYLKDFIYLRPHALALKASECGAYMKYLSIVNFTGKIFRNNRKQAFSAN